MPRSKSKPVSDIIRDAVIDQCAKCVPTNWCDSMLSGPDAVRELPARQTEELLRRIQDRIRSLKSTPQ